MANNQCACKQLFFVSVCVDSSRSWSSQRFELRSLYSSFLLCFPKTSNNDDDAADDLYEAHISERANNNGTTE